MQIRTFKILPSELLIMISVIYYWTLTSIMFNPIAIALVVILAFQIKSQNSTLGVIISLIVFVLNLFLILALISELSDFQEINQNWKILALFGSFYLGLNIILAVLMFTKYVKLKLN